MAKESGKPGSFLVDDDTVDGHLAFESLSGSRPQVEFVAGAAPELTSETRPLLHFRLRLATTILLLTDGFFVARWLLDLEGQIAPSSTVTVYRIASIVVLAAATLILWRRWTLSMTQLRAVELAVFGMVGLFFVVFQVDVFRGIAVSDWDGDALVANVRYANYMCVIMWMIMLILYGTFIPNTLWRGMVVMGLMSAAPIVIVIVVPFLYPSLMLALTFSEASAIGVVMAAVCVTANYGSYKIGSLRREAFEARRLGQYRLTEFIGAGGMGEVYLAEHRMLKRPCAIKLIRPGAAADAKSLARFEREVRATARLTHWNTVEIYDYGRADDGTFYYAMEYLPGLSLQEIVEQQGPLQPERAVYLLRQVAAALMEAHSVGLIHRDIKPSNIIASHRGGRYDVAKLLDFGLATYLDDLQDVKLTHDGAIAGSPYYMAPERFLENDDPDARCDIYSLGAVTYFLLTGRPPFRGEKPLRVLVAHAREAVTPPSQLVPKTPADLETIVMRCLSKDPKERFQDAASFDNALAACACNGAWTQEMASSWWTSRDAEAESDAPSQTSSSTLA